MSKPAPSPEPTPEGLWFAPQPESSAYPEYPPRPYEEAKGK